MIYERRLKMDESRESLYLITPKEGVLFALFLFVYFLPWMIAVWRGARCRSWVALVDVFFGWTVVGWFVALIMAKEGKSLKKEGWYGKR